MSLEERSILTQDEPEGAKSVGSWGLTISMKGGEKLSLEQIQAMLKATVEVRFAGHGRTEKYGWIEATLNEQGYRKQDRKGKGTLREYIQKMTGLSKAQVTRLIAKHAPSGEVREKEYRRHIFPRTYSRGDIELLAGVDEAHDTLNGSATNPHFSPTTSKKFDSRSGFAQFGVVAMSKGCAIDWFEHLNYGTALVAGEEMSSLRQLHQFVKEGIIQAITIEGLVNWKPFLRLKPMNRVPIDWFFNASLPVCHLLKKSCHKLPSSTRHTTRGCITLWGGASRFATAWNARAGTGS